MIDLERERPLTLAEAASYCPRRRRGRKPHLSTLYRWATRGCRGIVLETIETPSGRCTSLRGLQRFFDQLTEARKPSPISHSASSGEHRQLVIDAELKNRFGV